MMRLAPLSLVLAILVVGLLKSRLAAAEMGYPRPFEFRSVSPTALPFFDHMTMVVSDTKIAHRQGADNAFKKKFPDRPVLVQLNAEHLFWWGTWIFMPKQRLEDMGFFEPYLTAG